MAESDIHLKLDRILAILSVQQQAQASHEQSIAILATGLSEMSVRIDIQTELLNQLATAMSQEQDNTEMRDLIQRIEAHMAQAVLNGNEMVEALNALPQAMTDATTDGVRLALSDSAPPHTQQ